MIRTGQPFARLACALLMLLGVMLAAPAHAAVEISFYSREMGSSFPHAFVTLKGRLDATGEPVDSSVGFTAKAVTPAILMGSVPGHVIDEPERDVARSDRQFSVMLDDEGYRRVMAVVEEWRTRAQPSYNLNRRNCVHFVGELAQAAGLKVDFDPKLMKRPRSFLVAVRAANVGLLGLERESRTSR